MKYIRFHSSENGASLIEFALLVTLILIVAIVSMQELSWKIACNFIVAQSAVSAVPYELVPGTYIADFGQCTSSGNGTPDDMIASTKLLCTLPASDFITRWVRSACHF